MPVPAHYLLTGPLSEGQEDWSKPPKKIQRFGKPATTDIPKLWRHSGIVNPSITQ